MSVGRATQQRRRWPPRGSLTILFIISAQRDSGRNSVGIFPLRCAPNSSLKRLVGDAVAVDPAISSGLPLPTLNRQPPPGSRPEKYSTPATKGFAPHLFCHVTVRLTTSTTASHSVGPRAKPVLETGRPTRVPTALRGHAVRAFHSPHTALRHPRVS